MKSIQKQLALFLTLVHYILLNNIVLKQNDKLIKQQVWLQGIIPREEEKELYK